MPSELIRPGAERVLRWMDEGPVVFEYFRRLLQEYDQATEAARAAQADRERLHQQCEALCEEARQLHAEVARLQKDRADAAKWVVTMLQEAAARFPSTPPPA